MGSSLSRNQENSSSLRAQNTRPAGRFDNYDENRNSNRALSSNDWNEEPRTRRETATETEQSWPTSLKPVIKTSSTVTQMRVKKKVTFFDFKGLMAPVFTCFKNDSKCSLELGYVNRYAEWLKTEHISGVLVNGITGEGPALGLNERKKHAAAWWDACLQHDLILVVQIGGAPLPDVIELAEQAEELGVHAVMCLPELFYKPRSVEQLVQYCKRVSKSCPTRPFFYYHIPRHTNVTFDMDVFCAKAEEAMPNFFGIQYSDIDLNMGYRCLSERRVVLLGSSTLLAAGMFIGFDSAMLTFLSIRPDLGWEIYSAMKANNNDVARAKQKEINDIIQRRYKDSQNSDTFISAMKRWFNEEMAGGKKAGFLAGPSRKFYS